MDRRPVTKQVDPVQRVRIVYALLLVVFALFTIRLFYLQVIDYNHYKSAALNDQLRQYQIPAVRGLITAHLGSNTVPIVLNQQLYTLVADPVFIKHPVKVAAKLQPVIGGSTATITQLLKTPHTQYVVLATKLTAAQNKKILGYQFPGIDTQAHEYRTYPDGNLAAQVLGFVNASGQGEYGVEQAMNNQLAGKPGKLKAITDINGVPLAATPGNVSIAPVNGSNVGLTLNIAMESDVHKILKQSEQQYHAQNIGAVVLDMNTGAVKAMSDYPTFDPANYANVSNPAEFQNMTVLHAVRSHKPQSYIEACFHQQNQRSCH